MNLEGISPGQQLKDNTMGGGAWLRTQWSLFELPSPRKRNISRYYLGKKEEDKRAENLSENEIMRKYEGKIVVKKRKIRANKLQCR